MILIELIQGERMLDIITPAEVKREGHFTVDYSPLPPSDLRIRIRVLRSILESDLAIRWEAALEHNDLNLDPWSSPTAAWCSSTSTRRTSGGSRSGGASTRSSRHRTSIQRYWPLSCGFSGSEEGNAPWADWIPERWIEDENLAAEWLIQTHRDLTRFAPLDQWWLDWDLHGDPNPKVWSLLESIGCKVVHGAWPIYSLITDRRRERDAIRQNIGRKMATFAEG
jgi:hypothetical protein